MEGDEQVSSPDVRHFYVMWCPECITAGVDSLECCDGPKKEIGWVAATETKGTQG